MTFPDRRTAGTADRRGGWDNPEKFSGSRLRAAHIPRPPRYPPFLHRLPVERRGDRAYVHADNCTYVEIMFRPKLQFWHATRARWTAVCVGQSPANERGPPMHADDAPNAGRGQEATGRRCTCFHLFFRWEAPTPRFGPDPAIVVRTPPARLNGLKSTFPGRFFAG